MPWGLSWLDIDRSAWSLVLTNTSTDMQAGGEGFSHEALRSKAAVIADVALKALLWHLKPGQAGSLYTLACQACRQMIAGTIANGAAGTSSQMCPDRELCRWHL